MCYLHVLKNSKPLCSTIKLFSITFKVSISKMTRCYNRDDKIKNTYIVAQSNEHQKFSIKNSCGITRKAYPSLWQNDVHEILSGKFSWKINKLLFA